MIYFPCKRLIAHILLFGQLLASCGNPYYLRIGPCRTSNSVSRSSFTLCRLAYSSPRPMPLPQGAILHFKQEASSCWAMLESTSFSRVHLPVTFGDGFTKEALVTSNPDWQKQYIHIHSDLHDSDQPSFIYIGHEGPAVEALIDKTDVMNISNIPIHLTQEIDRSHTFMIDPGYTVVLKQSGDEWKAEIQDNRFHGFSRSYLANVKFEPGYHFDDLIAQESSYQSRHIHIISNKNYNLVYIGPYGLKGGGNSCSHQVWHCACGFRCPEDGCSVGTCSNRCIAHRKSPHICARSCGRCPKYYQCRICHSTTYCSNCCGCYEREQQRHQERQRREQEERERQAVRSKLDDALIRAPIEKESLDYLLQDESIIHTDNTEQSNQIYAYEVTQNGSHLWDNTIQDSGYNDYRRDLKHSNSSDSILSLNTLSGTTKFPLIHSNSSDSILSLNTLSGTTRSPLTHSNSSDSILSLNTLSGTTKFPLIHSNSSDSILSLNTLSGTTRPPLTHSNSSDSIFSLDRLLDATHDSDNGSISNLDSTSISEDLGRESKLLDDVYKTSMQEDHIVSPSNPLIASFLETLETYSVDSLPGEKDSFCKEINNKLTHVDPVLQQSIIEYFTDGKFLDPYIVAHYPVSEWIEKSLVKELVDDPDENEVTLNRFRNQWLEVTKKFANRVSLLKDLNSKKDSDNLSLLDVTNILDLILHSDSDGYNIVCSKDDNWMVHLKTHWLKSRLEEYLPNFSASDRDKLSKKISNMDWGIDIMQQFLKAIPNETTVDPILDFLATIEDHDIPDTLVSSTITNDLSNARNNKVQQWTHTIVYESLLGNIDRLSPSIVQHVAPFLSKLLEHSVSAESLEDGIRDNIALIESHTDEFVSVLELLCDYQVREGLIDAAFTLLSQLDPIDWVDEIDKKIVSNSFGSAQVYTVDELIERITKGSSSLKALKLKSDYDAIAQSYRSPSIVLQSTDNPSIGDSFKRKPIAKWNKKEVTLWAKEIKSSSVSDLPEIIAGVKRTVELHHGFSPRDTQLLSLLTILNPTEGIGRLAQINTGEGKSLIVAMLAAIHALQGKKVDVITTSTELSIPEVKKQTRFFESLGLTVAENSHMDHKALSYKSDVLYGTPGDFQSDILRTEFLGQDIRGDRGFGIVIVDEVDSMLFDNRTHSVRLSGAAPGMDHLELPLGAVWEHISQVAKHLTTIDDQTFFIPEDFERTGKEITLYSGEPWESCAVKVEDKRAFIIEKTQHHLEHLLRDLTDQEKNEYSAYQSLNNQILALEEDIANTANEAEKLSKTESRKKLAEELKNLPWSQRYPVLDIPVHLCSFARSQISYWTRNALNAKYGYKRDAHYTVQNGRIVPIHYNETGELQSNMVWSDGLAQFLQIKEGLSIDPEGVSTNFLSNVSFFKRYGSSIYGLTGTLGEQGTKDFLDEMYHTDVVVIPPYQHRSIVDNENSPYWCKELMPIVLPDESKWYQKIIERTLSHAQHQRAVLVICKYIRQVKYLADQLRAQYDGKKIFTYTGEDATFDKSKIDAGEIIIATNIAGRGTDLITSDQVEAHGGMYVAVTFLPESYRVEMQNIGRTARAGKKGMGQLIIYDSQNTNIDAIKESRRNKEEEATKKAIDDAKKMTLQDGLFKEFCVLESEYLPTVSDYERIQKWENLKITWDDFAADKLSPDKIAQHVNQRVAKRKEDLIKLSLDSLSSSEAARLTESDRQHYRDKAHRQARSEGATFKETYKENVLDHFCHSLSNIPQDLIACLKGKENFKPNCSELSQKYHWGLYDRKGFEERWGIWLKSQHIEEQESSLDDVLSLFELKFATPARQCALEDRLVDNPYFYVLKGNDYLFHNNVDSAIKCYDRAISMDPLFSVNARYNKAKTLLLYEDNKGERQELAAKELKKAKEIISGTMRPSLLTFDTLINQDQDASKYHTSQHIQHQLNLLGQQENYIEKACKVIEEAQEKGHHVKLTTHTIAETLNETDGDHSKAIKEASINGFTNLFTIERVEPPVPWYTILGLLLIGIAQIAVGCLITACTGGAFGTGLISEGVSDVITTVRAAVEGTFDWVSWATQKAISLAVSLISAGINGIKSACRAIVNTTKDLIGKSAVGATKKGIELAVRSVGTALAKGVVKECLMEAGQWCTNKLFIEDLEKKIAERVEKNITNALLNNPLVVKALELDVKNGNNCWQNLFIQEGLSMLQQQKEHLCLTMLREITLGVAKNKIPLFKQCLEVAGIAKMLDELTNYTNEFIDKFNAKVASHQSDIESAVQRMGRITTSSTAVSKEVISSSPHIDLEEIDIITDSQMGNAVYSSKSPSMSNGLQKFYKEQGPSKSESIVEPFKVQITHKLTNSVKTHLVNPALAYGINWTTGAMFHQIDKTNNNVRHQVKTCRDRRHESNKLANVPQNKTKKQEKENKVRATSKEISNKTTLNQSTQQGIERLKKDVPLDANDLGALAAVANAPIYIFDKKTGKLVDVVGDKLPGKPITLLHSPPNSSNPGHWEPLNKDIHVESTGTNNCLVDAVFAQFDSDKKQALQNGNGVKEKMIEMIHNHPKEANNAYATRDELQRIAPDELRKGGQKIQRRNIKDKKSRIYPSGTIELKADSNLQNPLADFNNALTHFKEKVNTYKQKSTRSQAEYIRSNKSEPSFGVDPNKTEMMMGALEVTFDGGKPLKLLTLSGGTPFCINEKGEKFSYKDKDKKGFTFVDPGNIKGKKVYDVHNKVERQVEYNRNCAGQKLMYALGEYMKANPKLKVVKIGVLESWYKGSLMKENQIRPEESCHCCKQVLPFTAGAGFRDEIIMD